MTTSIEYSMKELNFYVWRFCSEI